MKKKNRRLNEYLTGGEIAGMGTDYGTGALISMAASSIANMVDSFKMDVTPYHLKQNSLATGGKGDGNVEVEGGEMFETPDKAIGTFKGASHENGGIDVNLEDGTKIYSKRLKGPDGKTMADRKKNRENYLNRLMKTYIEDPNNQVAKNTLQRASITMAVEDTHDIMVMEAANRIDNMFGDVDDEMAKGGIYIKPSKRGTFTSAAKKRGMGVQEFASKVLANKDNYSSAMVKKANFAKNASKWKREFGGITNLNSGQLKSMKEFIYKCGGVKGIRKMQQGGLFNNEPNTGEPDYEQRLAMFRYLRDNPGATLPSQQTTDMIMPIEPASGMIAELPNKQPEIKTIGADFGKGLIENPFLTSEVDFLNKPMFAQNLPDQPLSVKVPPKRFTDDVELAGKENPFTAGDQIGMIGTGVSALGPMAMTLANRIGDKETPNFMAGVGSEALSTQEKSLQYLEAAKQEAQMGNTRKANQLRQMAANNLRGVGQQMANYAGITAQESSAAGQIDAGFTDAMIRQLQGLSGMQLETDKLERSGRAAAFEANQMDRDNFFTQLNQDLTNLGTGIQKSGADLNTAQLNEDFLTLLPELSSYGIGIRRKPSGGYELYQAKD